jgi:hypothetical protein
MGGFIVVECIKSGTIVGVAEAADAAVVMICLVATPAHNREQFAFCGRVSHPDVDNEDPKRNEVKHKVDATTAVESDRSTTSRPTLEKS